MDAEDDLPVGLKGVEIAVGDAAAQVALNILNVLCVGAVDVARQMEVVVVLCIADLSHRNHPGIAGDIDLSAEGVHDAVNIGLIGFEVDDFSSCSIPKSLGVISLAPVFPFQT